MKKIISVDFGVIRSYEEFEATLTYKMFKEISKYFDTTYYIYVDKNVLLMPFQKEDKYIVKQIDYYSKSNLIRLLFLIKMYYWNIRIIKKAHSDLVYLGVTSAIHNFFIFLYRCFCPKQKFFVQLYTPSVNKKKWKRDVLNKIVSWNLKCFKYIGAGKQGNQNCVRYHIPEFKNIPLEIGIPDYGYKKRSFENIQLLYVGTINYRDVWKSVIGFDNFLDVIKDKSIIYHIVGGGNLQEVEKLKEVINACKYKNNIIYYGRLSVHDLKNIFNICNIGISYVPNTEYNQNISTKTIEYCLAGMPVIATKGVFRSKIVTPDVGVLCDDDEDDFAKALNEMYINAKANKYSSEKIRSKNESYSISSTMKEKYIPYLEKIMQND